MDKLVIDNPDDLIFGKAPNPVKCGSGLVIGNGTVYPEINFTLPQMHVNEETWPVVCKHYTEIMESVMKRAKALSLPGIVVEFEQLPPMTMKPEWGGDITALIRNHLDKLYKENGVPSALRVTVVDLRDAERPPLLREGIAWENMRKAFIYAAQAGADILSIESIGGKEVHDEALMYGDLTGIVVGLGSLAWRDMGWLWDEVTKIAFKYNCIPGGDTACGFSNTAMQLSGNGMLPSVLAAIDRAASAPRSLAAYEHGAVGPSKDCAYEGPIIKAICGIPISMEGKSSSCAHFSPLGNIAGAAADLWSNESVQNIRLLSGSAPEAFLELLAYDCRLFNTASEKGESLKLRDWLIESDVPLSVEALMLEPRTVVEIARAIVREKDGYRRTVAAVETAFESIQNAIKQKRTKITEIEIGWMTKLESAITALPQKEGDALDAIKTNYGRMFKPEAYGLY